MSRDIQRAKPHRLQPPSPSALQVLLRKSVDEKAVCAHSDLLPHAVKIVVRPKFLEEAYSVLAGNAELDVEIVRNTEKADHLIVRGALIRSGV
jgi:hypothetical protein